MAYHTTISKQLKEQNKDNQNYIRSLLRDWSLITGRGGYKMGGGEACEVLPLQKGRGGGQRKLYAVGVHNKFWGSC